MPPQGRGPDETVGVARTRRYRPHADVSIVTRGPGAGDEVQALKAGIMEIADIFVVNKADHDGADRMVASIEGMLGLHTFAPGEWRPPIVKTEATTGKGVDALLEQVARFQAHSAGTVRAGRHRERAQYRLRELLSAGSWSMSNSACSSPASSRSLLDRIAAGRSTPTARPMRFCSARSG